MLLPFQYLSGVPVKMVKYLPKLEKATEFHPLICLAIFSPQETKWTIPALRAGAPKNVQMNRNTGDSSLRWTEGNPREAHNNLAPLLPLCS